MNSESNEKLKEEEEEEKEEKPVKRYTIFFESLYDVLKTGIILVVTKKLLNKYL